MTETEFFKLSFPQQVEIVEEYTTEVNHFTLADNYENYIYSFDTLFLSVIVNPHLEIERIERFAG